MGLFEDGSLELLSKWPKRFGLGSAFGGVVIRYSWSQSVSGEMLFSRGAT